MTYRYVLLDVFCSTPFQGNPLAVFPDADGLNTEEMQGIATELNLSETIFICTARRPETTHWVRIFTPTKELPFAGHPTIGAAITIARLNHQTHEAIEMNLLFEEECGNIPVLVSRLEGGDCWATLKTEAASIRYDVPSAAKLAALLSISEHAIIQDKLKPALVSCGIPFTMIPLKSLKDLEACQLNLNIWKELLAISDGPQVYPFVLDPHNSTAHVRMFAPALGQPEDAATGSAAAALGSYLSIAQSIQSSSSWTIKQGMYMGRESLLRVQVHPEIRGMGAVELSGSAVIIGIGQISIHEELDFYQLYNSRGHYA